MRQCFKCGTSASVGEVAVWDAPKSKWIWVRDGIDLWEGFWKRWRRYPTAVWDRPGNNIETCDIYCGKCWEGFGQHVKPYSKYALSKECEELAVRAGILFVDPSHSSHTGNPFLCPTCKQFFNAGVCSLQKHLKESHGDQQPSARKRKLDDAAMPKDFLEPVLYVPGCSNSETVSSILKGKYTAVSWHHGKPLYKKEGLPSEKDNVPVVLYFWDSRDGDKNHGWWFGPKEGGERVWAYNFFNRDHQTVTVPAFGWKVPHDGVLDTMLCITTRSQATDKRNDSTFELRWEFVASADGQDDWQPMSKDMNDALEKRWADGWRGDNGTDTFHVHSNGFTYGIDCYCMVQWNVRTHRRRNIRRGEVRPDVNTMLPKLAEKDAQVESLQSERNSLAEDNKELIAKVKQLERLGGKAVACFSHRFSMF